MKETYKIEGMTCQSCVANVTEALASVTGVDAVAVDLESGKATVTTIGDRVETDAIRKALPNRYTLVTKKKSATDSKERPQVEGPSKWKQLKPLFLILTYIAIASVLLHRESLDYQSMMLDFMGLFLIVFSFFKLLDVKGFAMTFVMYDPIAARLPGYASLYPYLETALGLMFLFRFELPAALIVTIILLSFTTYGVVKTLTEKREIKCACLGTALDLPMTEATFIENAIMIVMAVIMLVQLV